MGGSYTYIHTCILLVTRFDCFLWSVSGIVHRWFRIFSYRLQRQCSKWMFIPFWLCGKTTGTWRIIIIRCCAHVQSAMQSSFLMKSSAMRTLSIVILLFHPALCLFRSSYKVTHLDPSISLFTSLNLMISRKAWLRVTLTVVTLMTSMCAHHCCLL